MKTKNNSRSRKFYDNSTYGPSKPPVGDFLVNPSMSTKALKDLPKSSVTFKVDPYTNSMPHAIPYSIIADFNKKVGGTYAGEANLDGGNVQQYANSNFSGFLKYCDFMKMNMSLNYRYLPIDRDESEVGYGLVDESIKAMDEAASLLGATTFTQLAINDYVVETDLCMGSHIGTPVEGESGVYRYTSLGEVMYATSIYYQIFWQNIVNSFTWHNSFRLKQGTMIRSSWNRETPALNALFALYNKAAWRNLLEGIALSLEGEYIDRSFVSQCAMLNAMPSRRSNSITDPVLEIQTNLTLPGVFRVIYVADKKDVGAVFDSSKINGFMSDIETFNDRLSATNIMGWARNVTLQDTAPTANDRFNSTKAALDNINIAMAIVKSDFSFLREALDIMSRTGTVGWFKGFKPFITKDSDADLFHVMLIEDIYRLVMSGSNQLSFNNITKRWTTYSLWNMYNGIPEYDSKQGGSFLTMSCKDVIFTQDDDSNRHYLPIALNVNYEGVDNSPKVHAVARDGVTLSVTTGLSTMANNIVLSRLVPLNSQNSLTMRIPLLEKHSPDALTITDGHKSAMYKTLLQIFGVAAIYRNQLDSDLSFDIGLDPDIVAVYQIEIEDITNIAINYARSNAPIRASQRETSWLGFFGTSSSGYKS